MSLNPFKWARREIANISEHNRYIKELNDEKDRLLQEMQLAAEGREAENIPIEDSFKITSELLSRKI